MLAEIFKANTFLFVVFVVVMVFGVYYFLIDRNDNTNSSSQLQQQTNNLGSQLGANSYSSNNTDSSNPRGTDVRGISDISGGGGETNAAVFETNPPLLEGYVAGYGTKTSGGREYWVLLVATPQLDINGYEVDLRDIIGYNTLDTNRWQEGEYVRIFGTLESETVVRARAIQ